MEIAAVVAHDSMHDREPQPGPLRECPVERLQHAVELAGRHPDTLVAHAGCNGASLLGPDREDQGAAIIDINMGCPVKKVVNGHAGSSLMRDEAHAARILSAAVKAVKLPVTLKMRTGWDEQSRNAPTIARLAEASGIRMITVHGRTRCQFYKGRSDWAFVRRIKEAVNARLPPLFGEDLELDYDDPTLGNRELNLEEAVRGFEAGILTQAEARARLGEADPGGGNGVSVAITMERRTCSSVLKKVSSSMLKGDSVLKRLRW